MLSQLRPPVGLLPRSNLSGLVMPYMPMTLLPEEEAPQKVTATCPPGETRACSAMPLLPRFSLTVTLSLSA